MDFVSPIVTPIVESLLVPIKKHLGFLISSTKYVKDMKTKMNQLDHTEKDIQERKKTALGVSHHLSPWLEEVQKMKEKVESIPTVGIGCFSPVKRYKAGKKSYVILEQIKVLKERESEIIWTFVMKPHGIISPARFQSNFKSRDVIFNNVLEALQSDKESQKMVALCGMGGVGKTTMMEQLMKVARDSKMYDLVVKVVSGKNPDTISLQEAIAQYIGLKLTETTKDVRADRLRNVFLGMSKDGRKKVLITMDDVWKAFDLKDFGLSSLPNGFKLLFTSRFEYECTRMGVKSDSIFNIHVLDDEEAKKLFFGIVGLSDSDDPDLEKIGEDIVMKCGGFPIAIITIAKILSGNIKEAWTEVLSKLQNIDLENQQTVMYEVFKLSYNNLETEDEKAIFLLSGLFPEDLSIPVEDLMMYGWGLKLFTKVHTLAQARIWTNICVNNVIRANLLTESESAGCVKMHDLVRDFVLSNFTTVKQASIANQESMALKRLTEDENEPYERILLRCTGATEFPEDITNHDNLSLLILMDGNSSLKFPKDLLKRMKNLEVVTFEGMHIPLLPTTFIHSTKLRTLCLRSCSLVNDDIYFIGSLSNLETLSFAKSGLSRLPSAIGKLKNLKSLDLTGCVALCIEDGVFKNLESLEELYMRASSDQPIKFTDANCEELKILSHRLSALELEFFRNNAQPRHVSFKDLERFRISIGCQLEESEDYSFRNTLNLVADCYDLKECNIRDLFEKTEKLHLRVNDMNLLQDVSMQHSFYILRDLHVSKCAHLTYLFTFGVAGSLKQLERLTVSECPILRSLVGEEPGVIRFPKLSFMCLEGLPQLVSLCDDVIELPEMLELRLDGLANFTSIYSDDNDNVCEMQSLLNEEVVIPKLEKLDIYKMENLKQIWPCQMAIAEKHNVSMLKEITIRRCDILENLFPSNPLPLLNHLEEIKVEECGSVEVLFNIDLECVGEMEGYSSRLRSIDVSDSNKLKELWRMRGENNSDILINGFKRVEYIDISHCEVFRNLFTPITTAFDLEALTTCNTRRMRLSEQIDDGILVAEITELDDYIPSLTYLQRLQLVFEMNSLSNTQLPTVQPQLLLPYLEIIDLQFLDEMSHVWKCNWNKLLIPQHQPEQFPFQNLRDINLSFCHKIKYLFSPLMAKTLSNLKTVTIRECDGIQEVFSSRDDKNEESAISTSPNQKIAFFPHLALLELRSLPSLKSVDDVDTRSTSNKISSNVTNIIHDGFQFQSAQVIAASWSFCQYPQKISIYNCDAMGSLVHWYAVGQMKNLEELKLSSCNKMMEIFESELISYNFNNVDEGSASDVTGTMLTSPTLKDINTVVVPQLSNLKSVSINKCDLLPHIFTFSTLGSLNQLKVLKVKNCKAVQVIVKNEKGVSSKVVVFPRLETLELEGLPNLKCFFMGANDFEWPYLKDVNINRCPVLIMFTSGHSKTPKLKYINTEIGKYNVESKFQTAFPTSSDDTISKGMAMSFLNLVEINIDNTNVQAVIPSHALLHLEKLQQITIIACNGAKDVFEVELEGKNISRFNESQTVASLTIPNLTQVALKWAYDLKYLWKSNRWMRLEFPSLTTLTIDSCPKLEYVFTCSMVGSLVQLQDLHISYCCGIEVIAKEEKEEEECDTKVNAITLPRLKFLELCNLPRLKGFCIGNDTFSFPALDTLEIRECREIIVLTKGHPTTPELKVIDTRFGLYEGGVDINSFIKTKQDEDARSNIEVPPTYKCRQLYTTSGES